MTTKTHSKFTTVPFYIADLYAIELRDYEKETANFKELEAAMSMPASQTLTLKDGDTVIAITGFWRVNEHTLHVYILPSKYVSAYSFKYVRELRRRMWGLLKLCSVVRLQTYSKIDPETDRFHEIMGFTCESVMRKWGPKKEDYKVWVVVSD